GREDRAGPPPARLRCAPVGGACGRADRAADRREGDQDLQVHRAGHGGGDRPAGRSRADARREDHDRDEGPVRLGHGAPGLAPHERGPREGRRGLGRRHLHPPAGRADHGGEGVDSVDLASTVVDTSGVQFAPTSIDHFLFVTLTLGLGPLVAIMQTLWYRTGDDAWLRLTRFFGTLFLINFAIGVATGLVPEFEFGMNWSVYSKFVGNVFGAPLAIEGLAAFFLESTFLGLWIFGWDRLSPRLHLATIWIAVLGTWLSAYFILVANSWMQHPVGYKVVNGEAQLTSVWALLSN